MTKIPELPCGGCTERHPGCHADCEKGYKEWSEYKKREQRALHKDDDAVNVRIAAVRKSRAYFHKHRRK